MLQKNQDNDNSRLIDEVIIHRYYFLVRNPCGNNNGGCEQICVLSHKTDNDGLGYRCRCILGFDLHVDGRHCVGKKMSSCCWK